MPTTLSTAVTRYLRAHRPAQGTANGYRTTLRKWSEWGSGVSIEKLGRKEVGSFLDWVFDEAVSQNGTNPGRTANKVREHLRAILAWAWDQDLIDALPRFPKARPQRDVAGRHFLSKAENNALYFATHKMPRPRRWVEPFAVGRYWRAALVVLFNYGVDTGTIWASAPFHEPIQWRHVSWSPQSPDPEMKQQSPWGWLFYRRVKKHKTFWRPMNRSVHAHIRSIQPLEPHPDAPVFLGGGARPNARFQLLCGLAGLRPKRDPETGDNSPWELKDLRKTCATYYDEHVPESSIELLGHAVGGITYRHYAHRAPLAFKAIMTLPQPSAFRSLIDNGDESCPCCQRRFDDAG